MSVKTAVFAPMPTASDSTITSAKPEVVGKGANGVERVLAQLGEVVGAVHGLSCWWSMASISRRRVSQSPNLLECLRASGGGVQSALDEPADAHVEVERRARRHDVAFDAMWPELEAEEDAACVVACGRSRSWAPHVGHGCGGAEGTSGDFDEAVP
jgi:hypothetical protein